MNDASQVILVINHRQAEAENIKELIEFLDTPQVMVAAPEDWRAKLGDERLEAVFVGPDLADDEVDALIVDIGKFDANVPIVMLQGKDAA